MKLNKNVFPLLALASLMIAPVPVGQANPPSKAPAPVQKVFVPQGFDDNDNVEVILHGHFPNSCMKSGPVEVNVNADSRVISVKPEVFVYESSLCLELEVPFIQRVAVGNLAVGSWRVEVVGNVVKEPLPLDIARARSAAPDEALYAPVEDVVLLPDERGGGHRVVVSGLWPQAPQGQCFDIAKIESRLGPDNVLVVLPIAELHREGECQVPANRNRRFSGSAIVDQRLADDVLVHVRVMNGESLNKFYNDM